MTGTPSDSPVGRQADVLVVGAGPVGLLTAIELRRFGLDVRVVDRALEGSVRSKATILWPRQLELLERVGVIAEILARGHRLDHVRYYGATREIGAVSLGRLGGTEHPYGVSIPQPATEEILARALARARVDVERGLEVREVSQDPDGVTARVVSVDGAEQLVRARFLVGADGAHSAIRRLVGIPFDDDNPPVTFAITDVEIEGDVPTDSLGYHYGAAGALGLVPLGGTRFRVAIGVPAATDPQPPRALFQRALDERTTFRTRLGELSWSTTFTVRFRTAARFHDGRVVLVGDAAHIMSPAGGQGMNTGIQDAVALAWRLAASVHDDVEGTGSTRRLAEYSAERHADARRVVGLTASLTKVGLLRTSRARSLRDGIVRLCSRAGLLDRVLGPRLTQLDTRYGASRRGSRAGLVVGDRFPGTFSSGGGAGERSGLPRLDPLRTTHLVWAGALVRPGSRGAADRGAAAERRARSTAELLRAAGHHAHVVLPGGDLPVVVEVRLGSRPAVYSVRPDGHVGSISRGDGPLPVLAGHRSDPSERIAP